MHIKKPVSFVTLANKLQKTLRRFPLVYLDCLIGTLASLYFIKYEHFADSAAKILIVTVAGFFLFIAAQLAQEQKVISKLFANAIVVILLIAYFFFLPASVDEFGEIYAKRNFVLFICSIILVPLAALCKQNSSIEFWNFSKKLLIRLFFTFVSSLTLFAGTMLSLLSLQYLFGLEFHNQWPLYVLTIVIGVFAAPIFVSGIPENNSDTTEDYPRVIKVFAQAIMLPIIILYGVILYAYMAKIIFTGVWPEGLVANFVLGFAAWGIATMLALYPLREHSTKIKLLTKYYYAALILPVLLLFAALKVRVTEYGFTDSRLILLVLGLWLLGISVYFLVSRKYNIKALFYSLVIILLLSFFAPINIFSLAAKSQLNELKAILKQNNILTGEKNQNSSEKELSENDYEKLTSIISYLDQINRISEINVLFENKIELQDKNDELNKTNFFKAAGIKTDQESEEADFFSEGDVKTEYNYKLYSNKEKGISFAYPKWWGNVNYEQNPDLLMATSFKFLRNPLINVQLGKVSRPSEYSSIYTECPVTEEEVMLAFGEGTSKEDIISCNKVTQNDMTIIQTLLGSNLTLDAKNSYGIIMETVILSPDQKNYVLVRVDRPDALNCRNCGLSYKKFIDNEKNRLKDLDACIEGEATLDESQEPQQIASSCQLLEDESRLFFELNNFVKSVKFE